MGLPSSSYGIRLNNIADSDFLTVYLNNQEAIAVRVQGGCVRMLERYDEKADDAWRDILTNVQVVDDSNRDEFARLISRARDAGSLITVGSFIIRQIHIASLFRANGRLYEIIEPLDDFALANRLPMNTPENPKGNMIKVRLYNLCFRNDYDERTITLKASLKIRADYPVPVSILEFRVGDKPLKTSAPSFSFKTSGRWVYVWREIEFSVNFDEAVNFPIHSVLRAYFKDARWNDISRGVRFYRLARKYRAYHGPFYKDEQSGITAFFRQNAGTGTTFTVRNTCVTDTLSKQVKLNAAWFASKFCPRIDPIILYEKNAQHYEEGARIMFEKLVDEGVDNAWFVLRADAIKQANPQPKYRKRILEQHSFKHYLYFFRATKFIGTETLAHALELRCQNIHMQRKLRSAKNRYVFLQHGVTYMISLDAPARGFKRSNVPGEYYVTVNSQREADHFIQCAHFAQEDMLLTGMPKFDRCYLNSGADKILVMPTWRPWEFNAIRANPSETDYVKMINRIVAGIPAHLRDKVIVASHPLFNQSTFSEVNAQVIASYDELLRDVKLLITDYSSLAYDAFYRGANVVFYWEEKDDCMRHYGEPARIMIDEESAFGPVCYSSAELGTLVDSIYANGQSSEYVRRYREIVNFHDNRNSDRLVAKLKELGFL